MASHWARSDIIRLAVIWVVLSALGELAVAYYIGDYTGTASRQGIVTSEAVFFLLKVTTPVFILVVLIIVYAMIRFRVADDDARPSASQYRTAHAFPWGWVVVSTALNVVFIIHPGLTGLSALWTIARAAENPIEVDVTASQWQWRFSYPGQQVSNVAELVVPVDTPLRFMLRSTDVIHSFWVPAWGIKKAAIPGELRTLAVTPHRILETVVDPTARLQCAQICGAGHGEMRAAVRVVSRADFDHWVESQQAARGGGMSMPGMEMPGMDGQGSGMPGMEMPMDGDTSGMNMPDQPSVDHSGMGHGSTVMPGMEMPTEQPMSGDMPAPDMPAMAPQEDPQMPMDLKRDGGGGN